jgi:hypothetical protein
LRVLQRHSAAKRALIIPASDNPVMEIVVLVCVTAVSGAMLMTTMYLERQCYGVWRRRERLLSIAAPAIVFGATATLLGTGAIYGGWWLVPASFAVSWVLWAATVFVMLAREGKYATDASAAPNG